MLANLDFLMLSMENGWRMSFFFGGVGWGTSGDDVYMEMFVYLKSIHLWSWIAPIFVLKRMFVE